MHGRDIRGRQGYDDGPLELAFLHTDTHGCSLGTFHDSIAGVIKSKHDSYRDRKTWKE